MRICSGPGCLRTVRDDVRFCDECKPQSESDAIRQHERAGVYNEELDALRKSKRWQSGVRLMVIRRDPFCKRCDRAVSEIVDHIIPADIAIAQARESKRWPFDKYAGYFLMSNLQGLCRPCHGLKTKEDKAHVGEWPNVVEEYDKAPKKKWSF